VFLRAFRLGIHPAFLIAVLAPSLFVLGNTASANESAGYSIETINTDSVDLTRDNIIYEQTAHRHIQSSEFLPVDPSSRYQLSGSFRSVGTTGSRLYFGLATYDKDYNLIKSYQIRRSGSIGTVSEFFETEILASEPILDWAPIDAGAWARHVGF